jgi:hypothetical protein
MIERPARSIRADFADFSPATQLVLIEAALEAEGNSTDEIQRLRDLQTNIEMSIARARAANPYLPRKGTVVCHRCGAHVPIPEETKR